MGAHVVLSVDEIIATLKHSSLKTVITEGDDDYAAYRRIEEAGHNVSVLPVGGRISVLTVFERRADTGREADLAFIADRDIWVMSGVPADYRHPRLVFTDGYSLENDLYRDGDLEKLLTPKEREEFTQHLDEFLKWYSFSVASALGGGPVSYKNHPAEVLTNGCICAEFAKRCGMKAYDASLYETLRQDYKRLVRGKSLLSLLVQFLSHKDRRAKHSVRALMEIGAASSGPLFTSLCAQVVSVL